MAIFVKDPADGVWKQANDPTSKLLSLRWNDTWYSAANVWLRQNDAWVATDYVGVPGAPTGFVITSAVDNFSVVSFAWTAAATGAPASTYHVYFYHQDGSFWDLVNVGNVLSYNHNVGSDTIFQVEVFAVSAAGVMSPASNRLRYGVGHPQQTRQDPVYGWGTPFEIDTATTYVSTAHSSYPGVNATDYNWGTNWIGGNRSFASYFDGIRVYGPSSYRRVYSVKVWTGLNHRIWLGMAQDSTWYGGYDYPTNVNFWFDQAARIYFAHNYLLASPSNHTAGVMYEFVLDPYLVFTLDRGLFDVAVDELKTHLGGYRAAITEVILNVQDWTIVSYNTVVTVNQQNNYYW